MTRTKPVTVLDLLSSRAFASPPEADLAGHSPRLDVAVSGAPRVVLRLENAAALASAAFAYSALDGRWPLFALLFLVPDLSMLGYLASARIGAVSYNAAHSYLGSVALAAFAMISSDHGLLQIACIWAAHVSFDRMLGYGLKYSTSFGDTHLGRVGAQRNTDLQIH